MQSESPVHTLFCVFMAVAVALRTTPGWSERLPSWKVSGARTAWRSAWMANQLGRWWRERCGSGGPQGLVFSTMAGVRDSTGVAPDYWLSSLVARSKSSVMLRAFLPGRYTRVVQRRTFPSARERDDVDAGGWLGTSCCWNCLEWS